MMSEQCTGMGVLAASEGDGRVECACWPGLWVGLAHPLLAGAHHTRKAFTTGTAQRVSTTRAFQGWFSVTWTTGAILDVPHPSWCRAPTGPTPIASPPDPSPTHTSAPIVNWPPLPSTANELPPSTPGAALPPSPLLPHPTPSDDRRPRAWRCRRAPSAAHGRELKQQQGFSLGQASRGAVERLSAPLPTPALAWQNQNIDVLVLQRRRRLAGRGGAGRGRRRVQRRHLHGGGLRAAGGTHLRPRGRGRQAMQHSVSSPRGRDCGGSCCWAGPAPAVVPGGGRQWRRRRCVHVLSPAACRTTPPTNRDWPPCGCCRRR